MSKSWIQHPITHELIPREEYVRPDISKSTMIFKEFQPFVSPIDRTLIDDRGQLRRNNQKHGVTNSQDYSPEYYTKKKNEREASLACSTKAQKAERIDAIKRTIALKAQNH